jgi:hypothetical protein
VCAIQRCGEARKTTAIVTRQDFSRKRKLLAAARTVSESLKRQTSGYRAMNWWEPYYFFSGRKTRRKMSAAQRCRDQGQDSEYGDYSGKKFSQRALFLPELSG